MSEIFVEYQILPEHRSVYSQWVQIVSDVYPEFKLLEGVDQPNLFIEVWIGGTRETYEAMKNKRKDRNEPSPEKQKQTDTRDSDIDWHRLDEWIKGGAAKINIWHFKKVR